MKFRNMTFEISGIKEVRINGTLYTRVIHEVKTDGGKSIINKYFKREDGYLIHEHKFMNKLNRLQGEVQFQVINYDYVDDFNCVKRKEKKEFINKWRFWFSGETINIERIYI